ncbi:MAG: transposase, partial [Rikenellaceae bacterium]
TKLKKNAKHTPVLENELPKEADNAILIDEVVEFRYGDGKSSKHLSRRIAYWDEANRRVIEYLSNNFKISAQEIIDIYHRRWQIETMFKQLKQNFQLKYFLGDNVNARVKCGL